MNTKPTSSPQNEPAGVLSPGSAAPDPSLLFETLNAYQRSEVLRAAIELDLFSAIGEHSINAATLAARCKCSERGVRILADYLCIIGFLLKEDAQYRLTRDSQVFLVRSSPAYIGGVTEFLGDEVLTGAFRGLAEIVKQGRTRLPDQGTVSDENPVWVKFASAMGPLMRIPAKAIAEFLPFSSSEPVKALDVAAGHGEFGFAILRRFPKSSVTMLDWEPVLRLTRQNAVSYGLADRTRYLPGDAFQVALPEQLDLVLLPNFLHHFGQADCIRLLKRFCNSLRTGGQILIYEFIPNEDRISPPGHAAFALTMLCTTAEGDAYTYAEYKQMLNAAGISDVHFASPGSGMRFVRAIK